MIYLLNHDFIDIEFERIVKNCPAISAIAKSGGVVAEGDADVRLDKLSEVIVRKHPKR